MREHRTALLDESDPTFVLKKAEQRETDITKIMKLVMSF